MKILNFGSCNVDYVYSVEHIVVPGETLASNKLEIFPGGKGLNQSIAAARAGATVYHAGCIGSDSDILKSALIESNVDISYLNELDLKNGHAIIQVTSQGENSIFLFSGSNAMVSKEIVDSVLDNFTKDDIVLLQNEISNVPYIIDKAYEKGMRIAFNPAPFTENLKQIDFNKLSFLILNETEAMGFTGKTETMDSIDYIKDNFPDLTVILTVGKEGCIYLSRGNLLKQPAYKVDVVDTTAAGDTFIGYFLAGVCSKTSVKAVLKSAAVASAITVSRAGAAPSIPYKKEVEEKLNQLEAYKCDNEKNQKTRILNFLEDNLKTVTLSELAKYLGYTKEYASLIVAKSVGIPFSQILRQKRIEKAAELLTHSELNVSEIIEEIGYSNESFFRKHFKEMYGTTPFGYRKEHKK